MRCIRMNAERCSRERVERASANSAPKKLCPPPSRCGFITDTTSGAEKGQVRVKKNMVEVYDGLLQDEVMELFTIGKYVLNEDGTPVLDIKPYVPAYDSFADARVAGGESRAASLRAAD